MQLRRINALKPNRNSALIVDAGLCYFSAHFGLVEGMGRLEGGTRIRTKLECISPNGYQYFRRVCVRLTLGPELVQVDGTCNFQKSLRHTASDVGIVGIRSQKSI